MNASRDERRRSFDAAAETYATARPAYPEAVFDEIAARVPPPASVLEVGPGPGLATVNLAERGYQVVAVELGENLARVARRRLADYPSVQVVHADFHDWEPEPGSFDMFFSASAFHWIEPEVGYPKAHRALRPGGLLALVWNHATPGRRGGPRRFWEETDALYRRYAPSIASAEPQPRRRGPYPRREIAASGLFGTVERLTWRPTRQPVVLDLWDPVAGGGRAYTTIATWRNHNDVVYEGETYGWSKDREFAKVLDLPRRRPGPFELATSVDAATAASLSTHGWGLADALAVSRDAERYRAYIQRSRAEFTVAKDQNVRLRSGWFSDRSACYLAAGRPVITQDTGFGHVLPTGKGLFAFRDLDDILVAVDTIETDYEGNRRAAREIAAEYFDAERVIGSLLERAGLS